MFINENRNDSIFYHTTIKGMHEYIMKVGLRRFATPNFGLELSPCVYLSSKPFAQGTDYETLEVDLSNIDESIAEMENGVVKVYGNIPPECIMGVMK